MIDIYNGKKPLEIAAYSSLEAAGYLGIPVSTVRSWIKGYRYSTSKGAKMFKRVIIPADPKYLSFQNIIELFVLSSIRKMHVPLSSIRMATKYVDQLRNEFKTEHPLADLNLLTDKRDLFVERSGEYINITQSGQLEMKKMLRWCISRIEKGDAGRPIKLYPFGNDRARIIEIDPQIQFGRPCIKGTGVLTEIIYSRFTVGETVGGLSSDYGCTRSQIQKAIEYEKSISLKAA